MVMDRIKCAVYRRRIRVTDFFVDFDKHHNGSITEHQFVRAVLGSIGKEAHLTRSEVQILANYYRSNVDLRTINYRQFCKEVDTSFQTSDLEKDPLKPIEALPIELIKNPLQTECNYDENQVSELIENIRNKIQCRRMLTYPFFRDYDMGKGLSQLITHSQFYRVLSFLGLELSKEDCRQLANKFSDPITGEVQYSKFCEMIDNCFTASAQKCPIEEGNVVIQNELNKNRPLYGDSLSGKKHDYVSIITPELHAVGDKWPVETLIDRLRHLVLINRISLKPWFHDYDKLRTGFITRSRFERCLNNAGLNRIQLHDLTPVQIQKLTDYYTCDEDTSQVNWIRFVNDMNSVFTLSGLEKKPLTRVNEQNVFVQPRTGTVDWSLASDQLKQSFEEAMSVIRRKVEECRMLLKPEFTPFDRNHRGLVGVNNFRQIVSICKFPLTQDEINTIVARFANDHGFDYLAFLDNLQPFAKQNDAYKYPEHLDILQKANIKKNVIRHVLPSINDCEGVLDSIKSQVYRSRMRLREWFEDYDKLNHGYISKISFRRGIGVLPIQIDESQLNLIEDRYRGPRNNTVNWREFCAEVETVFQTPYLEKDPLKYPESYEVESEVQKNYLDKDSIKSVDNAIQKIAAIVKVRRLQLSPFFNDFDKTHRLTCTANQFRRVLKILDLDDLTESEWINLFDKYKHTLGITDNVNYHAFVVDVYNAAGIDIRTP